MIDIIKEYFQWTNNRTPEGLFSWQHLLYATIMVIIFTLFAIIIGNKMKDKNLNSRIKVLKITSIVMWSLEFLKIILKCFRNNDPFAFLSSLPLFLCSIILVTLPLAAFSKGRVQEAGLDFVLIFGVLCMIVGSFLSAGEFNNNPVLSFSPMVSATTHCISGFAAIYIGVSGLSSMKKPNRYITYVILLFFEILAYIADIILAPTDYESNYMFFIRPAGTPFSIVESIAGGTNMVYTIMVALLYFAYLFLFILIYSLLKNKLSKNIK